MILSCCPEYIPHAKNSSQQLIKISEYEEVSKVDLIDQLNYLAKRLWKKLNNYIVTKIEGKFFDPS